MQKLNGSHWQLWHACRFSLQRAARDRDPLVQIVHVFQSLFGTVHVIKLTGGGRQRRAACPWPLAGDWNPVGPGKQSSLAGAAHNCKHTGHVGVLALKVRLACTEGSQS